MYFYYALCGQLRYAAHLIDQFNVFKCNQELSCAFTQQYKHERILLLVTSVLDRCVIVGQL